MEFCKYYKQNGKNGTLYQNSDLGHEQPGEGYPQGRVREGAAVTSSQETDNYIK